MNYDYSKLRGRIREICGSEKEFSKQINLSNVSLSYKLNGKREWTQNEINKVLSVLKIPKEELADYFFCPVS